MQIRLKLMGVLKQREPPDGRLELSADARIEDALRALEISGDGIQVFTVNGQLERDPKRVLADGDELAVIPPVGGG